LRARTIHGAGSASPSLNPFGKTPGPRDAAPFMADI